MNDHQQTLTLDGRLYAVSDLPQVAYDTLILIQFVEARLQQLRGEMAVSQTAYARALKAELAQIPRTISTTTPSL